MSAPKRKFTHEGIFILRTPLLPFDRLASLGEQALQDPRTLPAFTLALEWASTELVAAYRRRESRDPSKDKEPKDPRKEEQLQRNLMRYLSRMSGRSTPLMLAAGVSVGRIGETNALTLSPLSECRVRTRAALSPVVSWFRKLSRHPQLWKELKYMTNPTVWWTPTEVRATSLETHRLIQTERYPPLERLLERARPGATGQELVGMLVQEEEVEPEEAESFVQELIEGELLQVQSGAWVTGETPAAGGARALAPLRSRLPPELLKEWEAIEAVAQERPVLDAKPGSEVAVDALLTKPGQLQLTQAVVNEIRRGAELHSLFAVSHPDAELNRFVSQFRARYENQVVPLLEVLDTDHGIGFGSHAESVFSPLLKGLPFGELGDAPGRASPQWLLSQQLQAQGLHAKELKLSDQDIARLEEAGGHGLPDYFNARVTLLAPDCESLERGEFQTFVWGQSPGWINHRFGHDLGLGEPLKQLCAREQALHPQVLLADVLVLPPRKEGNIVVRPGIREWELTVSGAASVREERQLSLTDLSVFICPRGQVRLWSRSLEREVLPRTGSAHNTRNRMKDPFRIHAFLAALAAQGWRSGFDWGDLGRLPYLPRVSVGNTILSRASWKLGPRALAPLRGVSGAAVQRALEQVREKCHLPRWVSLAERQGSDNELALDLESSWGRDLFAREAQKGKVLFLHELPWAESGLCVKSPEGAFAHELYIPFVADRTRHVPAVPPQTKGEVRRRFVAGDEWHYLQLYGSHSVVDELVVKLHAEVIQPLAAQEPSLRWFFIRYSDPDWHLRLRVHDPQRRWPDFAQRVRAALAGYVEDGRVWKLTAGTYEREVERYGGAQGIELSEAIFHADSEAIAKLMGEAPTHDNRWKLCFLAIHALLEDTGLPLADCHELLLAQEKGYSREFGVDQAVDDQHPLRDGLAKSFRDRRSELESLVAAGQLPPALVERRERTRPLFARLRELEEGQRLNQPLADIVKSHLHMHVNRFLMSAQRQQELVLIQYLRRVYESRLKRKGAGAEAAKGSKAKSA